MKQVIETTYPITFRKREAEQLGKYIAQQKSVVLIGMKRVGISNFLRFFINHPEISSTYIQSDQPQIFIQVDLNDLIERNLSAFWTLLLTRTVDAVENSSLPEVDKKACRKLFVQSIQLKDHFFTVESVRKVLDLIVSSGMYPTIFLIRFDRLADVFTEDFFGNLLGLRDSVKTRLSYIFTSHRPLPVLSPTIFKKQYLTTFVKDMYLPMATDEDMNNIAQTLMDQYHVTVQPDMRRELMRLSGGYVQYLQLLLIRLHEDKTVLDISTFESQMAHDEQITLQSEEIFDSLSKTEKDVVQSVVAKRLLDPNVKESASYVWNTGIVIKDDAVFSPLFSSFLRSMSQDEVQSHEFTKKEHLLFSYLLSQEGQLCEREKIVDVVWADGHDMGVSDWAVDRLIARLRSKLKAQHSPYQIETVVTRGYKLLRE